MIQCIHIKKLEDHYHEECSELYVTTLGDHDIIFGTDWLHAHNLEVDWTLLSRTKVLVHNRLIQSHLVTRETSAGHIPLVSLQA